MAHAHHRPAYSRLSERLNRFPQGAPPSDLLFSILKLLFSEKEAGLMALLPIRPFTCQDAAQAWKMDHLAARRILDNLAARALLIDMPQNGKRHYCLAPPMAGFFEFSLMRVRGDIDQKALSELYFQYINVEKDFIKALFLDGQTPLGRIFVQEAALPAENALHVLDYECAGEVIRPGAPDPFQFHRTHPGGSVHRLRPVRPGSTGPRPAGAAWIPTRRKKGSGIT